MPIRTVIFDLGDVLMPLNKEKMYTSFQSLGVKNAKELFEKKECQELYTKLEQDLDTSLFRSRLRELLCLTPGITDQQIDEAWSAMLEDIPEERLEYIQYLKEQGYKILLLSNSNEIHHANIQHRYGLVFGQLFTTQYYSHILKLAKPSVDVFKHVMDKEELIAEEILFLDDKESNVDGALNTGMRSAQFTVHDPSIRIGTILNSINKRMSPEYKQNISLSVFQAPVLATSHEDDTALVNTIL
ncbi:haloacid dehalogenase [Legionella antarctica]|uniref:Haloacid dehalogenase n=1 Tax=Legionella antarctica TaxID=2708020 RepID=A0A6F8T7S3_9GAMM|nr:HAD family phosphatase [Legionella antarctica]BCA96253.1 haloacid dehalogenase [Legionella antarctica]